jgi:hypothetical protein
VLAITSQLNHKIIGSEKLYSKRVSSQDEKFSCTTDQYFSKASGKSLYKRSTFQTEGNLISKKTHVKLSSIASEINQNMASADPWKDIAESVYE